jgi:hypothetical protein
LGSRLSAASWLETALYARPLSDAVMTPEVGTPQNTVRLQRMLAAQEG